MNNRLYNIRYLFVLIFGLIIFQEGCTSNNFQNIITISSTIKHNNPLVMVLEDRSDTISTGIEDQIGQAIDYAKIPYVVHDSVWASDSLHIPSSVRVLCLTRSEIKSFTNKQFQKILSFVASGNSLFLTHRVFDQRFNFLTGIKKNAIDSISEKARGLHFKQMIFPGYRRNMEERVPNYHNAIYKNAFSESTQVIATSVDTTSTPIITKNSVGEGDVYMFNTATGNVPNKFYRSLLFTVVLASLEDIPYPVVNASTIFIDDFPLPLFSKKEQPIKWEYNVSEGAFITKIWWPDMKALADTFNITYTSALAFNYNANVVPPFDFDEWDGSIIRKNGRNMNGSIWLAHQMKNSRHELGFHGYNHISLWLNQWPNEKFMVSAVKAARERWHIDALGNLPVTYVPPNDDIDSTGLVALKNGMPQLKYMCSLYIGHKKTGGDREFAPDPYVPGFFDYPRITSGYRLSKVQNFNFQGLYLLTGIWTHFVHPDDVFQLGLSRNRDSLGWRKSRNRDYGLYQVFKHRIRLIKKIYPMMRFLPAKKAVPKVEAWKRL
ncbi:MAG TPA: DUF2194 domain-containing protein, partial [Balneolaceae bacterium]|nr:DUF2194 domain-containing protein [Balneolaceae bacterium]